NGNEGLEEETPEYADTWFSEEPKQRDKGTDTEEDQLLEEPETQYSSKMTQHPSVASSAAESHSLPGSDGASSPGGPGLVYVPAEPAQLAAHALATASSEAGQPPPHPNVWTLFCLSDLRQGQKPPPPPPLSPAGAGVPYSWAALSPSRGEDEPCGQLYQASAPMYVIEEESNRIAAPPFILVGSKVQKVDDWQPLPGHTVFACGAGSRLTAVPVARPAGEGADRASPGHNSAEGRAAQPCTPEVLSVAIPVAIPLDDAVSVSGLAGWGQVPSAEQSVLWDLLNCRPYSQTLSTHQTHA
ncbi:PREDICTED: uncharacterized protein LOC104513895, partial [Eurypyga helias]|uniref:uncharacterized protein LOC104513895 n=1 Tax=Eurypyga helias TaxID=54383 RepID=UPI000528ABC4